MSPSSLVQLHAPSIPTSALNTVVSKSPSYIALEHAISGAETCRVLLVGLKSNADKNSVQGSATAGTLLTLVLPRSLALLKQQRAAT